MWREGRGVAYLAHRRCGSFALAMMPSSSTVLCMNTESKRSEHMTRTWKGVQRSDRFTT